MAEKKKKNRFNWISSGLQSLVDGTFLTRDNFVKRLPFIFFITLLAMVYIANVNYAEKTIRRIEKSKEDIRELKSEYITVKSDLMFKSNQSQISKSVEKIGLVPSLEPPRKIVVKKGLKSFLTKQY
ncbi:MAG: hypothetical protein KKA07_05315 [Bacteroidetes bacterium]|nr:hypothetical protein [Bacteroidota bacterium]MBU1718472.1 hypothetical protein [Bacteroidota bacterium]